MDVTLVVAVSDYTRSMKGILVILLDRHGPCSVTP